MYCVTMGMFCCSYRSADQVRLGQLVHNNPLFLLDKPLNTTYNITHLTGTTFLYYSCCY